MREREGGRGKEGRGMRGKTRKGGGRMRKEGEWV